MQRRSTLVLPFALAAIGLFHLTGCEKGPDLVPLRGQVFYQDKPLEYGSVMFQPEGGGDLARGKIQPDGTFELRTSTAGDGVRVGKSQVRITAFEAQRSGLEMNRSRETSLGESAIPRKYGRFGASGIVVDVTRDMPQPVRIDLE